jgi:hypothetical protein
LVQKREGARLIAVQTHTLVELRISRGPAVLVFVTGAAAQLDVTRPVTARLDHYARGSDLTSDPGRCASAGVLDADEKAIDLAAIPHAAAAGPDAPADLRKAEACCGNSPFLGVRALPFS